MKMRFRKIIYYFRERGIKLALNLINKQQQQIEPDNVCRFPGIRLVLISCDAAAKQQFPGKLMAQF